jgi:hypothetical protein
MAYSSDTKKKAALLHRKGVAYEVIREKLGIPKSTLSTWFGKNPRTPSDRKKQRAHLARIRVLASEAKHRIRQERLKHVSAMGVKEAHRVDLSDRATAKALLAMLYWAEGAKDEKAGSVKFANTDPALALLFIKLLRSAYALDEKKFRVRLHLHHYHSHRASLDFWSKLLQVPKSQFGKIHVKKRGAHKRFRRNFSGICFIVYHDTNVRDEMMAIARAVGSRAEMLSSFNG